MSDEYAKYIFTDCPTIAKTTNAIMRKGVVPHHASRPKPSRKNTATLAASSTPCDRDLFPAGSGFGVGINFTVGVRL